MKKNCKQTLVYLDDRVAEELEARKKTSGIPKSRIVQDALKYYWGRL